jgi:lipoprotein-anchoring transpeptidase ErfK/SrfK
MIIPLTGRAKLMVAVLKRAALFLAIVLTFAFLAAAASHAAVRVVPFTGFRPGTIVVKTHERRLYFVLPDERALRFPVGVGRPGMQWSGRAYIEGKYLRPAWQAPRSITHGGLGRVIPGGAPNNPMGVAALTLRGGEYAIHGTDRPDLIGGFVSHGCIRMYNRDIAELYALVSVGTPVIVER